jgi:cytochrome c peroxidase
MSNETHSWGSRRGRLASLILVAVGAGCSGGDDDKPVDVERDGFTAAEWELVQQLRPLATPMPRNPFNKKDQDVAVGKIGQALFYDLRLSEAITVAGPSGAVGEKGKVGCVTCHDPAHGFADGRPFPTSHGRTGFLRRNTPAMINLGWYEWIGWAGRHDSMVMHGSGVMGTATTVLSYVHYIYAKYRDEYNAAFPETPLDPALDPNHPDAARFPAAGAPNAMMPGPWESMTPADQKIIQQIQYNIGRIWDTYPRMLVTRNSPFERYTKGEHAALNAAAKSGLRLFIGKAACNACHTGPLLSDNGFHNIGVADPPGSTTPDMGRFTDMSARAAQTHMFGGAGAFSDDPEAGRRKHAALELEPAAMELMKGVFRTPMLLQIAETGPYFHTGLAPSLEDVVRHYNKGGDADGTFGGTKSPLMKPLGLTDQEVGDLVEFMKALTGDPPDPEWTKDISKP